MEGFVIEIVPFPPPDEAFPVHNFSLLLIFDVAIGFNIHCFPSIMVFPQKKPQGALELHV